MAVRVYKNPRARRRAANLQPLYIPGQLQTIAQHQRPDKDLIRPPSVAEAIHPGDLMVIDSEKADWVPPTVSKCATTPDLTTPKQITFDVESRAPSILSIGTTFVDSASVRTETTTETALSSQSEMTSNSDIYGWEEHFERRISTDTRRASSGSELAQLKAGNRRSLLYRVLNVQPKSKFNSFYA